MDDYPSWICRECGVKYGRSQFFKRWATFHAGTCDICGAKTAVTEPRDYGHLVGDDWKRRKNEKDD